MSRPASLSGFPEWLPQERLVEQHILDSLRRTFELHGFASVETRAVEPLSQLLHSGETSKEVYVLRRLHDVADARDGGEGSDGGDGTPDDALGLHFDLTVPLARYVVENAGRLTFPFKRYQIQKVWRGERPQDGRFREFYQADIDVIGADTLPYHFEAEVPLTMVAALRALPIPPIVMRLNNRKVAEGFYRGLGLSDIDGVLRNIDKLSKIGPDRVAEALAVEVGATAAQAEACLALAAITGGDGEVADQVTQLTARLGVSSSLLDEGLAELVSLLQTAAELAPGVMVGDLSIARGLDYYTGSVYETHLVGHEDLGSICSGGRYDQLASDGKNTYPGVGMSIGVSRLISRLLSRKMVTASRAVPTAVVVAVLNEAQRRRSDQIASTLRGRGIAAEVSPTAAKFGRQIRYADRRGIPYVWFPAAAQDGDAEASDQVRDIRSGEQQDADASTWQPPAADLWPQIHGFGGNNIPSSGTHLPQ